MQKKSKHWSDTCFICFYNLLFHIFQTLRLQLWKHDVNDLIYNVHSLFHLSDKYNTRPSRLFLCIPSQKNLVSKQTSGTNCQQNFRAGSHIYSIRQFHLCVKKEKKILKIKKSDTKVEAETRTDSFYLCYNGLLKRMHSF